MRLTKRTRIQRFPCASVPYRFDAPEPATRLIQQAIGPHYSFLFNNAVGDLLYWTLVEETLAEEL